MEAKVVRENTLKLKFGAESRNPTNAEVFAFFEKQGWNCDMLSAMYREDFSLFVKFQKEELLKDALRKLGHQVMFEYENGTKIQLAVSASNGMFKYVRLFGLPPEVEDKHIVAVFAKYGAIHHMVRERYPAESGFPIYNGVRGLNMEVVQDIPPIVYVQSIKARVFYEGIQHKCYVCGSTEHLKAECPKRKSVNTRLTTPSYAHPPVNRAGLNNEGLVASSVILPVLGSKVGDTTELCVAGTSSSSTGTIGVPVDGSIVVQGEESSVDGKVVEEKNISSESEKGKEWNVVKRLRSKESNGGVAAKAVKIDDGKGLSLLNLQNRRSRSLTPKQKKVGGNLGGHKSKGTDESEVMVLDEKQFPTISKS